MDRRHPKAHKDKRTTATSRCGGAKSPVNPLQQWSIVDRAPRGGQAAFYQIVNRVSGLALSAEGRQSRTRTRAGGMLADPRCGWKISDGGNYNLAKLTLQSVTAVKVSSGQDANTAALFTAIEIAGQIAAGVGTGGASAAGSAAWAGAKTAGGVLVKQGLKAGAKAVTKKVVFKGAKKGAAKAASDRCREVDLRPRAEDLLHPAGALQQVLRRIAGSARDQRRTASEVWPNGGRDWRRTRSRKQTHQLDIEYVFDASKPLKFELLGTHDSGSNDDSLGLRQLERRLASGPQRGSASSSRNTRRASISSRTRSSRSRAPRSHNSMLVGRYQSDPSREQVGRRLDHGVGREARVDGRAGNQDRADAAVRPVQADDEPGNVFYQQGFTEFDLVMTHNAVVGFEFADKEFTKTRGGARQSPTVVPAGAQACSGGADDRPRRLRRRPASRSRW